MNYSHDYHAGNFADVVKHLSLIILLQSLQQKSTPFCYLDTHAGKGVYDLFAAAAQKSKEYEGGIEKVIAAANPPSIVKYYLQCVHDLNNQLMHASYSSLRYYPGSPFFARSQMRAHDRLIACELQPQTYEALRKFFARDRQVSIHHLDGYSALKAFLPPQERRGVVLIDAPYENSDEFSDIENVLVNALKRWESGIYAIWYPIKDRVQIKNFQRNLRKKLTQDIFIVELSIYPELPQHLNGCGLAIINPPWKFDNKINEILPWLWKTLTINNQGSYSAFLLK